MMARRTAITMILVVIISMAQLTALFPASDDASAGGGGFGWRNDTAAGPHDIAEAADPRNTSASLPAHYVPAKDSDAKPAYGQVPLYFIANEGQVDGEAAFYTKASGYTLWLTKGGMVFDTSIRTGDETPSRFRPDDRPMSDEEMNSRTKRYVSKLAFVGANGDPEIVPVDETSYSVNYFKGDRSNWRTGIATFKAVLYRNVYSHIDLKVYGVGEKVEYDWIVNPGGDPDEIRIEYIDTRGTGLNGNGDIVIKTGFGRMIHNRPVSYQVVSRAGGGKTGTIPVDSSFESFGENVYGLNVGAYDTTRPLIIDPIIDPIIDVVFSTYLGGDDYDLAYDVEVDDGGCI